jgi:hypothetical protein
VLDLFGDSELALRLFPLVVGLASLGLFYLVSRRILDQFGTLVGMILFATMEPFVRYSAEVKQYGLDVAVCLALVYLFVVLLEPGHVGTTGAIVLAGAGPCAVFFSHPSVFVLAGVAVAGLYLAVRTGDKDALVRQSAAYVVWLISFLVVYLVAIRDLHDLQGTVGGVGGGGGGRVKNLYTIFNEPGGFARTAVGLAAAAALIGVVSLWRRRPGVVVLLGVTTSSLLVAGYLGLYPVGQRFLLFLLPFAVLCFAEGVSVLVAQRPSIVTAGLLAALAALILLPVAGSAAKRLAAPPKAEEIEPLLGDVRSGWRSGDLLYLSPESQYAFRYYADCKHCGSTGDDIRRLWPVAASAGGQAQSTEAIVPESPSLVVGQPGALDPSALAGHPRVWLLYTHFFPRTEDEVLAEIDLRGRRISCDHGGASLLCLYDFSRTPPAS